MEEDNREYKHVCKFCNKRFPSGRSLGGHMRSHLTNNSAETDEKLSRKKLQSVNNGGSNNTETGFEVGAHTGYGLREKPKKTWRLADSSDETSIHDKFCKDCGKGFQSWKALFGHMKCHSEKVRVSNNNSLEEQGSWTSANQKMVMDSQSDNEAAVPNRRRRSRRRTRYMATATTSSSFSFVNVSSSVSEIELEQEEVAMCLMMLSRDVGHWGGLNSVAECSDNSSVFLETPSSIQTNRITKIEAKNSVCNGSGTVKLKKLSDTKLESGDLESENVKTEGRESRNGSKMNKKEVLVDGLLKNDKMKKFQLDDQFGFEDSKVELGKNLLKEDEIDQAQLGSGKHNSSKRKFRDSNDPELRWDSLKKLTTDALDSEICKNSRNRSKFACTTCNKVFHSYQALGGHRASHKKIRGCFASNIGSSEKSIETEISLDPTSELVKSCNNENPTDHEMDNDFDEKTEASYASKERKRHECPICLKVFPSGQALGGHKRSHLVGGSEARNNQTIVIQKPIPEIRDFLDLNLPAPVEEESNRPVAFKSWWIGSSHKHEPLVGLISN